MILKTTLKTKEELDALLVFLDIIERKLYKKKILEVSEFKNEWEQYSWFDEVLERISQGSSNTTEQKIELIEEIVKWARGLEQVKLVLPFKPSQDFIDKVWVEVAPSEPFGFVLDISVDKTMTSGGRMFHRGRYTDLTLKPKIENYFSKEDVITKYL